MEYLEFDDSPQDKDIYGNVVEEINIVGDLDSVSQEPKKTKDESIPQEDERFQSKQTHEKEDDSKTLPNNLDSETDYSTVDVKKPLFDPSGIQKLKEDDHGVKDSLDYEKNPNKSPKNAINEPSKEEHKESLISKNLDKEIEAELENINSFKEDEENKFRSLSFTSNNKDIDHFYPNEMSKDDPKNTKLSGRHEIKLISYSIQEERKFNKIDLKSIFLESNDQNFERFRNEKASLKESGINFYTGVDNNNGEKFLYKAIEDDISASNDYNITENLLKLNLRYVKISNPISRYFKSSYFSVLKYENGTIADFIEKIKNSRSKWTTKALIGFLSITLKQITELHSLKISFKDLELSYLMISSDWTIKFISFESAKMSDFTEKDIKRDYSTLAILTLQMYGNLSKKPSDNEIGEILGKLKEESHSNQLYDILTRANNSDVNFNTLKVDEPESERSFWNFLRDNFNVMNNKKKDLYSTTIDQGKEENPQNLLKLVINTNTQEFIYEEPQQNEIRIRKGIEDYSQQEGIPFKSSGVISTSKLTKEKRVTFAKNISQSEYNENSEIVRLIGDEASPDIQRRIYDQIKNASNHFIQESRNFQEVNYSGGNYLQSAFPMQSINMALNQKELIPRQSNTRQNVTSLSLNQKLDQIIYEGRKKFEENKLDDAVQIFYSSYDLVSEQNIDTEKFAEIKYYIAAVYHQAGDWETAQNFYLQSWEIYAKHNNQQKISEIQSNLGNLYNYEGQIEKSNQYYKQSIETIQKAKLTINEDNLASYANIAVQSQNQGDFKSAEEKHEQVIKEVEKLHGKRHQRYGDALNNYGTFFQAKGEFREALVWYERAYAIYQEVYKNKNNARISNVLNNIATAYEGLAAEMRLKADKVIWNIYHDRDVAPMSVCVRPNENRKITLDQRDEDSKRDSLVSLANDKNILYHSNNDLMDTVLNQIKHQSRPVNWNNSIIDGKDDQSIKSIRFYGNSSSGSVRISASYRSYSENDSVRLNPRSNLNTMQQSKDNALEEQRKKQLEIQTKYEQKKKQMEESGINQASDLQVIKTEYGIAYSKYKQADASEPSRKTKEYETAIKATEEVLKKLNERYEKFGKFGTLELTVKSDIYTLFGKIYSKMESRAENTNKSFTKALKNREQLMKYISFRFIQSEFYKIRKQPLFSFDMAEVKNINLPNYEISAEIKSLKEKVRQLTNFVKIKPDELKNSTIPKYLKKKYNVRRCIKLVDTVKLVSSEKIEVNYLSHETARSLAKLNHHKEAIQTYKKTLDDMLKYDSGALESHRVIRTCIADSYSKLSLSSDTDQANLKNARKYYIEAAYRGITKNSSLRSLSDILLRLSEVSKRLGYTDKYKQEKELSEKYRKDYESSRKK